MTLKERYNDLTQPLAAFGKTYPARIKELSIENLQQYAKDCINSNIPALKAVGFEMNRNIFSSGYDLNGHI